MNQVAESLHIGDIQDASRTEKLDQLEITAVISLTPEPVAATTRHTPLVDGENDQYDFDIAVEAVKQALQRGEKTFVHCNVGSSRTGAVVATALAERQGEPIEDIMGKLKQRRPIINPRPELLEHAHNYLNE